MSENKQALQVAALKNGTVIDHIPSEKLFTVVQLLGVEQMTSNITIGFNLDSTNGVSHYIPSTATSSAAQAANAAYRSTSWYSAAGLARLGW